MPKSIKLALIVALALSVRLIWIHTVPPALFSDEVDIANQVNSFRRYQTDYFGNSWPLHFHSFSDWRTSLPIYSSVLVSYFTADPVLIVRLPSVIFSVLTVILICLITDSTLAALLLAVSPWSIHFGRTGFEVSGMLFVLLAGIYYWLRYQRSQKLMPLILSVVFFCLAPYFYSTAKLFLVLLLPLLLLIWPKTLKNLRLKKTLAISGLTILLLTPLAIDTLQGRAGFRFSYISIFSEPHREQITDTLRYQDILLSHPGEVGVPTPFLSFILHNKYQLVWQKFVSNYFSSFSTVFLFLKGDDNLRQGFASHGLLYLIDCLFIPFGLCLHFRHPTKLGTFFFYFLLLAPIPFALTFDSASPHATRLILMLPALIYFAAQGLKKYPIFIPIYLISFLLFWHQYTIHYPQDSAKSWHFNLKEAILAAQVTTATDIYFSDSSEPFLPFFLLYFPYSSAHIAADVYPVANDTITGSAIANRYFFGHLNWSNLSRLPPSALVVAPESDQNLFPSDFRLLHKIDKTYLSADTFYLLQKI